MSCAKAGIHGMIIPDLPFADYLRVFKPVIEKDGFRSVIFKMKSAYKTSFSAES